LEEGKRGDKREEFEGKMDGRKGRRRERKREGTGKV
jgi:hypothetical protein